jgi:hypothetical protein
MRRVVVALALGVVVAGCGRSTTMPTATQARSSDLPELVTWAKGEIHINLVGPLRQAMVFSTTRLAAYRAGTGANPGRVIRPAAEHRSADSTSVAPASLTGTASVGGWVVGLLTNDDPHHARLPKRASSTSLWAWSSPCRVTWPIQSAIGL